MNNRVNWCFQLYLGFFQTFAEIISVKYINLYEVAFVHLGPVHTFPNIFENGDFFSVCTSRPHVNSVFGHKYGGF